MHKAAGGCLLLMKTVSSSPAATDTLAGDSKNLGGKTPKAVTSTAASCWVEATSRHATLTG
jgi:hypothetical protein